MDSLTVGAAHGYLFQLLRGYQFLDKASDATPISSSHVTVLIDSVARLYRFLLSA